MKAEGDYYLAHPFDSRHDIRKWELEFEKKTGIILINPFYDVYRQDVKLVDKGKSHKYACNPEELVERDLKHIRAAKRGLVAIINEKSSHGTQMEMVYAKRIYKKEVYSIITNGDENHPWLNYHSDKVFTGLLDFEMYIVEKFFRNN